LAENKQDILIRFLVTDEQKKLIQEKMKLGGISNMSMYIRKMVLDGYIIKLDLSSINEVIPLLRSATNNINQIAKRVNATENIYRQDIADVNTKVDEIWDMMEKILMKFVNL